MRGENEREDELKLSETLLCLLDPLIACLEIHFDLGDGHVDLGKALAKQVEVLLDLGTILDKDAERLNGDLLLLLALGDLLGRDLVGRNFGAHSSLGRSTSSSRHGSRRVNELSIERNDPPSFVAAAERKSLALLEIGRDERVGEDLVEAGGEPGILGRDEVKEARRVLGRLDRRHVANGRLVQAHQVCATEVVLAEVVDAGLRDGDGVGDEVVEAGASCRDRDIVLAVDASQVAQTALGGRAGSEAGNQRQRKSHSRGNREGVLGP
jgi:hypothetical protein